MKYLVNTFSLNMLELPSRNEFSKYILTVENIDASEFCSEISEKDVVNAIGHQSTIDVINLMCNTQLSVNRIEIKLTENHNELLVFQLLMRPKEGQVFTKDELIQLLKNNKVILLRVDIVKLK